MILNKIYLVVALSIISFSLQAQIVRIDTLTTKYEYAPARRKSILETEYKYTLVLKAIGSQQYPKHFNQLNSGDFIQTTLNGLMFKFNDNQISYRLSGDYYHDNDFSFKNECSDCEVVNGKVSNLSLKVGFEKTLNISTIQPYFGFDIGFNNSKFDGDATNAGNISFTTPYHANSEKTSGVLGPVLGIKFNLVKHLTFGVESGLDFLFTYEKQEKNYNDAQRSRTFKENKKVDILLKPLAIFSLQYNFGEED